MSIDEQFRRFFVSARNNGLPTHLAYSFDGCFQYDYNDDKSKRPGRTRLSKDLVIGRKGYCSAEGCPTKFLTGFKEKDVGAIYSDDVPAQIDLFVIVLGSCVHEKGKLYGQCRGVAREELVEEYKAARLPPSEFAKSQLATAPAEAFHCGNRAAVPTRPMARALSCEAKTSAKREKGLGVCKLSNVNYKINAMDLEQREDKSTDLPGIDRGTVIDSNSRMKLYSKPCVVIYHKLGETGKLVVHVDATGQIVRLPLVEHMADKMLVTQMIFSAKTALLSVEHLQDDRKNRLLSPLTACEFVSNKNTAADIGSFYLAFRASERELYPNEAPVKLLLFSTDCSAQLQSASLTVFAARPNLTRMQYGNVVLLHLCYFDSVACRVERGSEKLKETAKTVKKTENIWHRYISERVQVTCLAGDLQLGQKE